MHLFMRSALLLPLALGLLHCNSGTNSVAVTLCEQRVSAACKRLVECKIRGTLEDCTPQATAVADCAHAGCPTGKTYNPMTAERCNSDIAVQPCSELSGAAAAAPASCGGICQ